MRFIVPLAVLLLVGVDQATKLWAATALQGQADIRIWPGVFHLTYVENRGAAFGMMQGKQWVFIMITLVVLAAIIWYWRYLPQGRIGFWMKIALVLIIGGAIGNLIDRIGLNFVRDMFYFVLIDFPVFNVADIGVVVGVILLFPLIMLMEEPEKNNQLKVEDN